MAKSLQEQLLGAGLVDNKKAKAIKQEKRKQKKQQPKGQAQVDESKVRIEQERREKQERDRQLNQERQEKLREKEIQAQIKQVIQQHRIERDGELGYQFADGSKIQKIYVNAALQDQLARGRVVIVKTENGYDIVPRTIGDKIAERDAERVIIPAEKVDSEPAEDDPYADYPIPDDLMW